MFHPVNQDEYEMQCKGLGSGGESLPGDSFSPEEDHPGMLRTYRVSGMLYPRRSKGVPGFRETRFRFLGLKPTCSPDSSYQITE
jgi:hypothetical protein